MSRTRRPRTTLLVPVLAVAGLLLTACGESSTGGGSAPEKSSTAGSSSESSSGSSSSSSSASSTPAEPSASSSSEGSPSGGGPSMGGPGILIQPHGGTAQDGSVRAVAAAPKPGAPRVDLYLDLQCPACGMLEKTSGKQMLSLAQSGAIDLRFHVMTFLDRNLGNDASSRAAEAAYCAADVRRMGPYVQTVYANMPAEEGSGYTDSQLREFAGESGIAGKDLTRFQNCVKGDTYQQFAKRAATVNESKATGTPTIYVDGTKLNEQQMSQLMSSPGSARQVLLKKS